MNQLATARSAAQELKFEHFQTALRSPAVTWAEPELLQQQLAELAAAKLTKTELGELQQAALQRALEFKHSNPAGESLERFDSTATLGGDVTHLGGAYFQAQLHCLAFANMVAEKLS